MALQHLRSSTANKRPTAGSMSDGQLALNTNVASPGVFFKDSTGALVKAGPVHVGTTAPNASPAVGGSSGNSIGELWLDTSLTPNELKTWNGSAWVSATGQEIPVSKLIDGAARQLLQTDAAGTGVEWTSNVDVPGTLDVTGATTLNSTLTVPLGSAAAPTLRFTGDTNTGLYSPGADQVAISTNGTGRLFVDASGNVGIGTASPESYNSSFDDLVVATSGETGITIATGTSSNGTLAFADGTTGDQTYRGFVQYSHTDDALVFGTVGTERLRITSDGKVGLGTSSPQSIFDCRQETVAGAAQIRLYNTDTSNAVTQTAQIALTPDGRATPAAGIEAIKELADFTLSGNRDVSLAFNVTSNNGKVEAARFTSAGRLGIGTTAPGQSWTGGAANVVEVNQGTAGNTTVLRLRDTATSGTSGDVYLISSPSATATLGNLANGPLTFYVNNGEAARFDSSKRLLVGTSSYNGNGIAVFQGNTEGSTGPGAIDIRLGTTRPTVANTAIGFLRFMSTSQTSGSYQYANIAAYSDGASTSDGDIPGRLVFSTTADGESSPTGRITVNSAGETVFTSHTVVRPGADNATLLGQGGDRWSAVWAANGTIQTSDQRAKTEVNDANLGSDFIKSLRPVSYKWIEGGKRYTNEYDEYNNWIYESVPGTRTHWGFIAQEVKQAVDAAGVDFGGWVLTDKDDPDSQQALRYDQFIAPLTKALQEAMERIEVLEQRLTDAGIA
jgi:hypothetical protein